MFVKIPDKSSGCWITQASGRDFSQVVICPSLFFEMA